MTLVGALVAGMLAMSATACTDETDDADATDTTQEPTTVTPEPVIAERDDPLPAVTPTPQDVRWIGPDVAVTAEVDLVARAGGDDPTRTAATEVLTAAGAETVDVVPADDRPAGDAAPAGLTVRIGAPGDAGIDAAFDAVGLDVPDPLPTEGYALAAYALDGGGDAARGAVTVAAADAAGGFYAMQTLRRLTRDGHIAGVGVVDHPAMAIRGTIEGFYGSPWTHEERLDQLDFYGRFKLNTYVYAPKDDPFHRQRWREPYPPEERDRLRTLVDAAAANHVRFTFAVSPGPSICYSDPDDTAALLAKLRAIHDLGVRTFSIALDDIEHTRWNCDADADAFGPASSQAAAQAQVQLLNTVRRELTATRPDVAPLQMVPTEYQGTDDSPYRTALRTGLHPAIEVMWTGRFVVPAEITLDDAAAAAEVFGRPPLVWDNTPVNDFPRTEGRLLLGPYARREPGLSDHVSGLVLNPMNQAAASKVALVGAADFAWNDAAYDPARAHRAAAAHLSGGDEATIEALLAFFDVEHLAPTSASDGRLSQPQAPALAAHLETFRTTWEAGDRAGAVAGLRPYAELLAGAPEQIRAGVTDPAFLSDTAPWLDALALWGDALVATLDGLDARVDGDTATAASRFADADRLVTEAGAVTTIPGETRPQGPVRVADGVLDTFLAEARDLH